MRNASLKKTIRERRLRSETCVTHVSDDLDQSAVAITIADPLALIALSRTDPVAAAREGQAAMETLETGFNEYKIGLIGTSYASAYHMLRTKGAWERFLKDPGWGGLTSKPKNNLRSKNRMLHHVMRYMFRAESGTARARVRVYANMLIDRFHKGFPPDAVVPLINRWGIENMRKAGEAQRRANRQGIDPYFADLNDEEGDDAKPSKPAFRSAHAGEGQRNDRHRGAGSFFNECDEADSDGTELTVGPVAIEETELSPAQFERFKTALATLNAGLMDYWLSRMKRD